jgi:hypothetical protein
MTRAGSIEPNFANESMTDVLPDKMGIDLLEIGIMNMEWGPDGGVGSCGKTVKAQAFFLLKWLSGQDSSTSSG